MSDAASKNQVTQVWAGAIDAGTPRPVPPAAIDPHLAELTMSAVVQMHSLVVEYLARDGYVYVPRRSRRSVTAYESGWPNVGGEQDDAQSVAHGRLFARERSSIHPFQYDDIEAMRALDGYVRTTPVVLERASLPEDDRFFGPEMRELMLRHRIEDLPTSIYDRAMALGLDIDDPAVLNLYLQREKSWLAPVLTYQLVVPLVVTGIDTDTDVLEIDDRTRLQRLEDDDLRLMSQRSDYGGVSGPLADAARWAVVVDMPPMANPGEGRRLFSADAGVDTIDSQAIEDAVNTLRIVSGIRTGWARVFRRPIGWADIWQDALPTLNYMQSVRRYPASLDDRGWLRPNRGLSATQAARVPAVAAAMRSTDAKTQLAIRRLSTALVRDAADDQLIDACIGLEALLGQKGSELSYRIAVRAAALLGSRQQDPLEPTAVFRMARKVYERRSELVHGSTSDKNATFHTTNEDSPIPMNAVAVRLLREVLLERLLRPKWRVEDLDDLVLTGLRKES